VAKLVTSHFVVWKVVVWCILGVIYNKVHCHTLSLQHWANLCHIQQPCRHHRLGVILLMTRWWQLTCSKSGAVAWPNWPAITAYRGYYESVKRILTFM